MSSRTTGWLFVAVQALLLTGLILLPGGDAWPRPAWLRTLASAAVIAGLALIAIAALGLGTGLTPTPVPRDGANLVTGGLFRFVRHPIYTGVLLCVAGVTLGSGSVVVAGVAGATAVFFLIKSRWEERRLAERYPDYAAYAETTGRFLPRVRRRNTV